MTANTPSSLLFRHTSGAASSSNLALLVHGRAGNAEVMGAFHRAIPADWHTVSPQAPHPDPVGGFSWWEMTAPPESWRSQAEASVGSILAFLDEFMEVQKIEPRRIVAVGFSQGGALLSLAAQRAPERFGGIALLASFVLGPVEKPGFMPLPDFFVAHGTDDTVIPIERARDSAALLRDAGARVEWHEEPVGHKIGSRSVRALGEWLAKFS